MINICKQQLARVTPDSIDKTGVFVKAYTCLLLNGFILEFCQITQIAEKQMHAKPQYNRDEVVIIRKTDVEERKY
jgi:hypothetical protein